VPEPVQPEPLPEDGAAADGPARTEAERAADHAAIERLSGELLPALMAKLAATGLGELEVREGGWRVRLRRPAQPMPASSSPSARERRAGDKERPAGRAAGTASGAAAHLAGLTAVGPGRDGREGRDGRDPNRIVATSPAVGIFQPRPDARAGTKVRAGDRLGSVDVLGIAQEVVAPSDGVLGASLVEPGDAVEYGQDLLVIEFATAAAPSSGGSAASNGASGSPAEG
jgi:biotin carboxyl carrier protein